MIEERLAPLYQKLRLQPGQLEAWTGIRERRWWDPGFPVSAGATRAGRKALEQSDVHPSHIGSLVYCGVCRDNEMEPATACAVAHGLGLGPDTEIMDLSNACLGMINGILTVANRIELGQIRAGLVVSCESARDITEIMIDLMLREGTMDYFKGALATLTGGSGAAAVLLTDGSWASDRPRLVGGFIKSAAEHHGMCWWGKDKQVPARASQIMHTNAIGMLKHGGELIAKLGASFYREMGWTAQTIDRLIAHQVAAANRDAILRALGIEAIKDFSTFPYLGNIGTVSLPLTAAMADERGFLEPGHKVGFVGIGSGLNALMLGWEWA